MIGCNGQKLFEFFSKLGLARKKSHVNIDNVKKKFENNERRFERFMDND